MKPAFGQKPAQTADTPIVPDPRDQVDLSSVPQPAEPAADSHADVVTARTERTGRPWLALWFRCSNSYTRAYRSADGKAYLGRCPRCAKTMDFKVGEGGTTKRFFEVSC